MELREKIYKNLRKVPKGKVVTYKELGKSIGINAFRFVGSCMKNNPDPVKTPCYKVVLSSGKVGNYSSSGGQKLKIEKLRKDGIIVENGKVNLKKFGYRFL